mgnify:CR=1 FL=1
MGLIKKKVKASNPKKPNLSFEHDFWIDTGALYSFIPEDWLEKIQIEPTGKRNLIFADGKKSIRSLGFCNFEIEGLEDIVICPVIFASKGSIFLLGATALENFGVEVDPTTKTLKPITAIIGAFLASVGFINLSGK